MKRKAYLKPTTCVVKVQMKCQILEGSDGSSARDYVWGNFGAPTGELDENDEWLWI